MLIKVIQFWNDWTMRRISFVVVCFCMCFGIVLAQTQYAPGQSITIGEFVYDDDYNATTTNCYISIWSPAGSLDVNNQLMTANANGWHYYVFSGSTTLGTWPTAMSCGTVEIGRAHV